MEAYITTAEERLWENWEQSNSFYDKNVVEMESSRLLLDIPVYTHIDELKDINFRSPFIIRNLGESNVLSLDSLTRPPLSELIIDYFSDARKKLLVPDRRGSVGEIVQDILSGGPQKIGTQTIVMSNPSIVSDYLDENNDWIEKVFGKNRVQRWRDLGVTVTVPVFVSRGPDDSGNSTTRTDLHCEPISNVVLQTFGEKKWTLVEPQYSHLLKPTISPDGRAYFYSSVDPFIENSLSHVPRYEVVTRKGDLLFVPTWVWHKVEYIPNVTAVSMSLFEFIGDEFLFNNPVFAMTIIPNLIKEAIGLKTQ